MRLAFAAAVACLGLCGLALAASSDSVPSAFTRPAVATDRLPAAFAAISTNRGGPRDSRRIATYVDGKRRRWSLFIFREAIRGEENICAFVIRGSGGGGGCDPSVAFFVSGRQVVASEGHVLAGVASDRVARITVIGSRGLIHHVTLTPDHGFIYDCAAYNGCTCAVARLEAFDRTGKLITNQPWLGSRCKRR